MVDGQPRPEVSRVLLQTNRPEDFYWDLNRTRIDLQDTETAAALSVRLSGPIPNLSGFEVRRDEGEWEKSGPSFEWGAEPGPQPPAGAGRQHHGPPGAGEPGRAGVPSGLRSIRWAGSGSDATAEPALSRCTVGGPGAITGDERLAAGSTRPATRKGFAPAGTRPAPSRYTVVPRRHPAGERLAAGLPIRALPSTRAAIWSSRLKSLHVRRDRQPQPMQPVRLSFNLSSVSIRSSRLIPPAPRQAGPLRLVGRAPAGKPIQGRADVPEGYADRLGGPDDGDAALSGFHQFPCPVLLSTLLSNQGPFPQPAFPGFNRTAPPPPPPRTA